MSFLSLVSLRQLFHRNLLSLPLLLDSRKLLLPVSYAEVQALTRMIIQALDRTPLHKAALIPDYTLLHKALAHYCSLPRMFQPLAEAQELAEVQALSFYMA